MRNKPWSEGEMHHIRIGAQAVLNGASYYSQMKLIQAMALPWRSQQAIRKKLYDIVSKPSEIVSQGDKP